MKKMESLYMVKIRSTGEMAVVPAGRLIRAEADNTKISHFK